MTPSTARGLALAVAVTIAGCGEALPPTPTPTILPPPVATATRAPAATSTEAQPSTPADVTPFPTQTPIPPTLTMNPATQTALTTQLIQAAEAGDTPAVLRLLQLGAALNGQDERGRTAVMAATHGRQVETVRALIQAGADINQRDQRLDNPFLYAGAEGLYDILVLAIDAGADPRLTNRYGGTALIPAAERGHVAIVELLLTRTTVEVNHINNLGWTALLEAIVLSDGGPRHQRIVELLLAHGADPGIADKDGVTPLAHARQRGFVEIERLLLAAGQ